MQKKTIVVLLFLIATSIYCSAVEDALAEQIAHVILSDQRGRSSVPRSTRSAPRTSRSAPRANRSSSRSTRSTPRNNRSTPRTSRSAPRNNRSSPRSSRSTPRNTPRTSRSTPRNNRSTRGNASNVRRSPPRATGRSTPRSNTITPRKAKQPTRRTMNRKSARPTSRRPIKPTSRRPVKPTSRRPIKSTTKPITRRRTTRPTSKPIRKTNRPSSKPIRKTSKPSSKPTRKTTKPSSKPIRGTTKPTGKTTKPTTGAPTKTNKPSQPSDSYTRLKEAGIPISSSGKCNNRNVKSCTSLDGMKKSTIDGVINFKKDCGPKCNVVITGGSEVGHSQKGEHTHGNGYKTDISVSPTIDKHIKDNYKYIGVRGDGAPMYQDKNGNIFAREGNHWDISWKSAPSTSTTQTKPSQNAPTKPIQKTGSTTNKPIGKNPNPISKTTRPTTGASTKTNKPITPSTPRDTSSATQASKILKYEGRFDKNGNLKVYNLPKGDGGGSYEVAGINERYHPKEAATLKRMVENGQHTEAKKYASEFLGKFTDTTAKQAKVPAIQFYLRDSAFNRGPGGAAKILQHALGVPVTGKMDSKTTSALKAAETGNPQQLLGKLRASREWYERNYAHRNESSKFWKGLVNRWNNAEKDAIAFGFTPQP